MTTDVYYYGQGRLFSRVRGTSAWQWWGDVSALQFGGSEELATHKESFSGQRAVVRKFSIGGERTISGTLHQMDTDTLARLLRGKVSTIEEGEAQEEQLGSAQVGQSLKLAAPYNVSNVIIKHDGTTLREGVDYDLRAAWGSIELRSATYAGKPLTAQYDYQGARQVAFFADSPQELELRYEGVNLAQGHAPVIVEFYKVSTQPLKSLSLITGGSELAGIEFEAEALLDASRPVSGALGQFGRFVQIAPTQDTD